MTRRSTTLIFFLLFIISLPSAYGSTSYCTPNYSVAPLPNTQSGNFNSTGEICFVVQNNGPLGFNCSNMQNRTVTVNGTPYSSSACAGNMTANNTNDGDYYFDISPGGVPYASIAFWAESGSGESGDTGGSSGSCVATLSAGQQWSDRYNLNVSVTGSDNWRVKMTLPSPEEMIATWNIDPYWPPPGNMLIAAPNGSGNNWGVTIRHNGNWTWPTVTCEAFDDPWEWVNVKINTCPHPSWPPSPSEHNLNQCNTDVDYALAGGGAYAEFTGAGAFLTGSWPEIISEEANTKWWSASSQDLIQTDAHTLNIYTIGLRLDGINLARLNHLISLDSMGFPSGPAVNQPSGTFYPGAAILSGGAWTETGGAGQLLTHIMANGDALEVASKQHLLSSPGSINAVTLTLPDSIIEGFGALQIRQMQAAPVTVTGGIATSTGQVSPGWKLTGLGGTATTTSGPGRMLFRIGVDESGSTVTVQSKDHILPSAGRTTASWIEVRKAPGSHGMCNTGPALLPGMDACVANICSADPHCCTDSWDNSCVAQVTSVCGHSCENYSCSGPTRYNPDYWNDWDEKGYESVQSQNNCYNYATNTRTDATAQPGKASGHYCVGHSGCTGDQAAEFATNDGLIPTTLEAGCPGNQSIIALAGSDSNFHWYRRDWFPSENRYRWTSKDGSDPATDLDAAGNIILDIEAADRGNYTDFIGYFCTCSSSIEGQGHAEIE